MKVLVIEDDPDTRLEIQKALTTVNDELKNELARRGVAYAPLSEKDIALADSRESALQQLTSSRFDLVLLDLLLPALSRDVALPDKATLHGYEILSTIRSLGLDSEVIILSNDLRREQQGLVEFENRLLSSEPASVPDDLLWKGIYRDAELLQRKIASYLVDLSEEDENALRAKEIYVPPAGVPSYTRRILRTLKRISWCAEDGRPLPDIILMGERGSGKATFARALHLLRPTIGSSTRRLGFEHVDMAAIYGGGAEDPLDVLLGSTSGEHWSLGALPRGTFYMRGGSWLRLPGQEVQEDGRSYTIGGTPNPRLYPHSSDKPNFGASGTVYLENPFSSDSKVNREIELILGPDIDRRYITTRGRPPVRLHVGPCVVLGVTAGTMAVGAEGGAVVDLPPPQIGQIVIPVRPLRERSQQEKIWFLEALVNSRRGLGKRKDGPLISDDSIRLDDNMVRLVGEQMYFRDNLDDLQAIAIQVLPEERSISWRHLRRLWERDRQLAHMWLSNEKAQSR